jgi:hypothetical protein
MIYIGIAVGLIVLGWWIYTALAEAGLFWPTDPRFPG